MLKAIASLASSIKAKGTRNATPTDRLDLSNMPIIVAQSVVDALPDDPDPLVGAVIDYVNSLISQGRFNRREVPAAAMGLYHSDYYLAQVNNGGHSQFVHNCAANLPHTIADVLQCFVDMGAEEYLMIFQRFNEWVQSNPEEVTGQTGFTGGRASQLDAFDDMFCALESDGSLREMLATWIATQPNLLALPDEQVTNAISRLCAANPHRAQRDRILRIAGFDGQMTTLPLAAISMAAGTVTPPAPVIRMGKGSYQNVDDEQLLCLTLL